MFICNKIETVFFMAELPKVGQEIFLNESIHKKRKVKSGPQRFNYRVNSIKWIEITHDNDIKILVPRVYLLYNDSRV